MPLGVVMIPKMSKIQFFKDILHGNEPIGILLDDIGLGLLDIISYVPDMNRIDITSYQPHLIDINSSITFNLLPHLFFIFLLFIVTKSLAILIFIFWKDDLCSG